MRRFLVTLKQLNNTEVVAIVEATTKEEATKKALGSANNIAKGGQSKVITSEKPLEVVRVEAWEDCSLRVVKGEKQYGVLLITQQGSLEDIVRGVAGIKSAYAYTVKQSKVQVEVRTYIYDLEQKPVGSFINKDGNIMTEYQIEKIIRELTIKIITDYVPHKWVLTEDPFQNQYNGRTSYDYSGEVEKMTKQNIEQLYKEVSSLEELLDRLYIDRWKSSNQPNRGKDWVTFNNLLYEEYKEWIYDNFEVYDKETDDYIEDVYFGLEDSLVGFLSNEPAYKYIEKIKSMCEEEIDNKEMDNKMKEQKEIIVDLEYNQFKGSGKCWIAMVDSNTKKILSFVNAESVQKNGNTKGFKTFKVCDGYYLSCETGTKSYDRREYFRVKDGKIQEF